MASKKSEREQAKSKSAAKAKAAAKTAAPVKKATAKGTPGKKAGEKRIKAAPIKTAQRHPRARLVAAYGSKEQLAKTLAATLAREDQDTDILAATLKKASNQQLLRLAQATETVKKKWGNRDKLIAAIGTAQKKSTDKDFLAKLDTYSLPHLIDLATSAERAARATA